ncbi:little elongation complex subunit 2-like [Bacillus rossius redtenbacheri]|uniref:little elongation complex subunit 2-like n=1 Tax=Bacillus rossius redtenbacheri TaxID=93214 RepID=UPI002FDD0D45
MEEEDVRALSSWHGEPNFQEDWFRNSAMERILSNCFVENLRIQNLFNTKARPRKPQINVLQPEPQAKISVYVPGGKISVESTLRSELTSKEQKEYLRLYLAYKCKGKGALQKQEENMFTFLRQKVVEENVKYEEFVQASASKKEEDYHLQESIRIYTSQAWQFRLAAVDEYPALFKVIATLPLVTTLDGSLVRMKLERTVLELGEAPNISPPQFQSKLCCGGQYDKLCRDYPIHKSVMKMCPVSKDATAERLALAHNADIVISSSALLHLADNYPNFDKVWDIPVVIKELEHDVGSGNMKKIIFIDKALPSTTMTAEQRNLWFHKIAVKKMFCCQNKPDSKHTVKRPTFVAKKRNKKCKKNRHKKTSSVQEVENAPGSEVLSQTGSNASGSDEPEAKERSARDTTEVPASPAGTIGDAGISQRGVKRKQVVASGGPGAESDGDDESDGSSSGSEGKLMIACDEAGGGRARVSKKRRTLSFDDSEDDMFIDQGTGGEDKKVLEKLCGEEKEDDYDDDDSPPDEVKVDKSAFQDEPMEHPSAQQSKEEEEDLPSSLQEPSVDSCIAYSMWQLCLQENEKEDLKERILKKKIQNKHLRILVRCKVDGVKTVEGESQKMCIVPKMEHKVEFGAERLSSSEIIRSWVTLFFRPGVNLARVRIDAKTSEVLMFEETNLKELMEYASFSKFPVQSTVLGTLYTVLTAIDGYKPGTYLMSHRRDSFFNFLQADMNGRHDLKTVYRVNCNEVSASRQSQYLPVDPSVLMPRNVICGRIPGTFTPKPIARPGVKKKKFKKRKK